MNGHYATFPGDCTLLQQTTIVLATPQCCKFSGGEYTPLFYRRLSILNINTIHFTISLQIIMVSM